MYFKNCLVPYTCKTSTLCSVRTVPTDVPTLSKNKHCIGKKINNKNKVQTHTSFSAFLRLCSNLGRIQGSFAIFFAHEQKKE